MANTAQIALIGHMGKKDPAKVRSSPHELEVGPHEKTEIGVADTSEEPGARSQEPGAHSSNFKLLRCALCMPQV